MAALIDAYEHEIDLVISDARSRLADVENQLKEAREAGTRLEMEFDARLNQAIVSNDEQWKVKVQVNNVVKQGLKKTVWVELSVNS